MNKIRFVKKNQINRDIRKYEPNVSENVIGALYYPDEGHVNPKRMTKTIGLMAIGGGTEIHLNHNIESICFKDGQYLV